MAGAAGAVQLQTSPLLRGGGTYVHVTGLLAARWTVQYAARIPSIPWDE